ncbi:hypothetical protein DY468_08605 [Rhodopseudomonas sp. BR0M22]|nr:hypothetical protein [Rhodopseudomonas sp. BR0M22]
MKKVRPRTRRRAREGDGVAGIIPIATRGSSHDQASDRCDHPSRVDAIRPVARRRGCADVRADIGGEVE